MSDLKDCRNEINAIDEQMAALFEQRMQVSKKVAEYKQANGLPIRDKKTESEKIARQKELIQDDALRSYYPLFQQNVMDISSS